MVASGYVYPNKYMVIADQWDSVKKTIPEDAIVGVDPTYQTQAYWIGQEDAKATKNVTAVDATDVLVTHLQECVRKHVDEVMTKTDVLKLMELVKSQDPTLVNDLVPTIISTSDLRKIFVNLIREKVSIKDIIFVFERLCDYARFSKEPKSFAPEPPPKEFTPTEISERPIANTTTPVTTLGKNFLSGFKNAPKTVSKRPPIMDAPIIAP